MRARVLRLLERVSRLYQKDVESGLELAAKARQLAAQYGDLAGIARALLVESAGYFMSARYAEALAYARQGLAYYVQLADRAGQASALMCIGDAFHATGRWRKAIEFYERALAPLRSLGDSRRQADLHRRIGVLHDNWDEWEDADRHFSEGLRIARRTGDRLAEAKLQMNVAACLAARGNSAEAFGRYEECRRMFETLGDTYWAALVDTNRGVVEFKLGQVTDARRSFEKALAYFGPRRLRRMILTCRINLCDALNALGERAGAARQGELALRMARRSGDRRNEMYALDALSRVAAAAGESGLAVDRLNAAIGIAESLDELVQLKEMRVSLAALAPRKGKRRRSR